MLEDSEAKVLLTHHHLLSDESAPENVMWIEDVIKSGDSSAPEDLNENQDLAICDLYLRYDG